MSGNRPRHIRDIAHLYISRLESERGPRRRILISGAGKECYPGFHVANVAAALAAKGKPVRLVEASGLLPSSAYYLSLPPEVYLPSLPWRGTDQIEARWVRAIDNVSVCVLRGSGIDPRVVKELLDDHGGVDLIHSPPDDAASTSGDAAIWRQSVDADVQIVGEVDWVEGSGHMPSFVLATRPCAAPGPGTAQRPAVTVRVTHWEQSLSDRVPVVVRDPESKLARDYGALCDRLLALENRNNRNAIRSARYRGSSASTRAR